MGQQRDHVPHVPRVPPLKTVSKRALILYILTLSICYRVTQLYGEAAWPLMKTNLNE